MKLVLIESPYAGDVEANVAYAKRCMRDCLHRGEAPYASHLLLTQEGILDDAVSADRALGIEAGLAWGARADLTAVYVDHGVSSGMAHGIRRAIDDNRLIELRTLHPAFADQDSFDLLESIPEDLREAAEVYMLRRASGVRSVSGGAAAVDHPILVLGARIAEAFAKEGILDVEIKEDGCRATLVVDGMTVFISAEPRSLDLRVGDSHVSLSKHSTSGEVVREICRIIFEERLALQTKVG